MHDTMADMPNIVLIEVCVLGEKGEEVLKACIVVLDLLDFLLLEFLRADIGRVGFEREASGEGSDGIDGGGEEEGDGFALARVRIGDNSWVDSGDMFGVGHEDGDLEGGGTCVDGEDEICVRQ